MKEKAIEIVKNLTRTINKIGKKRKEVIEKYNLKQKEWK